MKRILIILLFCGLFTKVYGQISTHATFLKRIISTLQNHFKNH
jgi:hypothetical protein